MENITIKFDDHEAFDFAVHGDGHTPSLPEGGNITIITKDKQTLAGAAIAVITWEVEVEGMKRHAQAVTTVRLLHVAFQALASRYDSDGKPRGR